MMRTSFLNGDVEGSSPFSVRIVARLTQSAGPFFL